MVGIRTSFTRQFLSTFTTNVDRRLYKYIENEKGGGTRSAGSELLGGNSRGGTGRVMTGLPGSRGVKDEGAGSLCCGRSMQQRCPQPQQQQPAPLAPSNIAFA